ncbi:GYDIA family GHMP kinase [Anaerophaga thermohalophila]|uniref:GYDIA family GHMP kinase n=1 Tax=Anaerophaga thermohalophila TaxID=177400 RepID=UPI000237C6E5|nr:GYDIA family GHMP kinase [Anaerophaga thermohalophila]
MNNKFHSNGKLLLSGEYLILHGARGLAVPLKKGQSMIVNQIPGKVLAWKATHPEGSWFSALFNPDLTVKETTNRQLATSLKDILNKAAQLKGRRDVLSGKEIITHLEFSPDWGWGSSSTLISNLSEWLDINPYLLLSETFGGSGYDIACATADGPVFYRLTQSGKPEVNVAAFDPPFIDNLWIGYLNRKQNSTMAVRHHLDGLKNAEKEIEKISDISLRMSNETSEEKFMNLMAEHEGIISSITGLVPLKKRLFPDFPGAVKSLGAWGGDFFLVLSPWPEDDTKEYFQTKGFKTLFRLRDVKLDKQYAGR